jgi:hypothetical protein
MNGMRPSKTAFVIDGVNATNQWIDGVVTQPSPDAIEEFKVQSNALSAEFGQGGGIISIQLKSGTNSYHATLFEFLRNDRLDARNFQPGAGQKGSREAEPVRSRRRRPDRQEQNVHFRRLPGHAPAPRQLLQYLGCHGKNARRGFLGIEFSDPRSSHGAAGSRESRGDDQRPLPRKSNPT